MNADVRSNTGEYIVWGRSITRSRNRRFNNVRFRFKRRVECTWEQQARVRYCPNSYRAKPPRWDGMNRTAGTQIMITRWFSLAVVRIHRRVRVVPSNWVRFISHPDGFRVHRRRLTFLFIDNR